ncbi:MAG: hypothetical protein KJ795_15170 [Gammaproteobacteria bacterium]|nr:hypothetical protein [Gammaproteobacteria bacterium]MBU1776667.1 hypothetical protein [Gammaproteobacteria bacterium]MBU1968518.1 hypothetical protein [Gammaproteobacteria bacterium]
MNRIRSAATLLLTALFLLLPNTASASDEVTSKHLFKKEEHLDLVPRICSNGMPPIIIAYHADPIKRGNQTIPFHEVRMPDKTRFYVVSVEEDTEGLISQFCDPRTVKPFFDSLKIPAAESASK